MTNVDVDLAKSYVDMYSKQMLKVEESLREFAVDNLEFNLLLGELLKLQRLSIAAEELWKDALRDEFVAKRREAARKRPFWR